MPYGKEAFYFINHNLYVVPTPLGKGGKATMIEDFFKPSVLKMKLNGKTFNPSKKGFNNKTEYGKVLFSTHIVSKNRDAINFDGFKPILNRIEKVRG